MGPVPRTIRGVARENIGPRANKKQPRRSDGRSRAIGPVPCAITGVTRENKKQPRGSEVPRAKNGTRVNRMKPREGDARSRAIGQIKQRDSETKNHFHSYQLV